MRLRRGSFFHNYPKPKYPKYLLGPWDPQGKGLENPGFNASISACEKGGQWEMALQLLKLGRMFRSSGES